MKELLLCRLFLLNFLFPPPVILLVAGGGGKNYSMWSAVPVLCAFGQNVTDTDIKKNNVALKYCHVLLRS